MRLRLALLCSVLLVSGCLVSGCAGAQTALRPDPPLVQYAPMRHPFHGAVLYHDPDSEAARWEAAHNAAWLDPITSTPQARWLNGPEDLDALPRLAADATQRHQLLVLVTYYLPDRGCTHHRDGAATPDAYQQWIDTLIDRLGPTKAAIIMEPDAIPADCYDDTRAATLTRAVTALADAGHFVYLDAGHPKWKTSGDAAERLIASGISRAEGFSVNVANRQTTADAQRWGLELADLVGGREFVIDTSRNGIGPPPDDPDRDDEWCNPEQQALGQPPTTEPDLAGVAALLWVKRPGESDGVCGGESTYMFADRQARRLIANSPWVSATAREAASAS